jgi:Spy/CpxP family protein refolding chaperone
MTDEQRQAMRARMDSLRADLQPLQDEADQYYQAIRAALTPEQYAKFDALSKPQVMPPMRRGGED